MLAMRDAIGRVRFLAQAALAAAALAAPAWAQQGPLRVTVNHATAITLDAAAAVVLIADPEVADVVNERNNLMFVLGRKPGATNLLVYDGTGKRLVEREVVVVPQDSRTVTITRETDQTDYTCDPRCAFREHLAGAPEPRSAPPPRRRRRGRPRERRRPPFRRRRARPRRRLHRARARRRGPTADE